MTIHMTGLGVIIFLAVFLALTHFQAKKHGLNTHEFMKYVPIYIVIIYLCGSYVYYLIEELVLIPLSIKQILLYISPYKYAFHSIGITAGAILGGWRFLQHKSPEEKREWINIWAYALLWAVVPLGIFLVLGDSFIGKTTESSFYVSAIRSDSAVAIYDKVIPLGLWISCIGLLGGGIMYIVGRKSHPYWGLLALSIFNLSLAFTFLYQQYPRRLVSSWGGTTIDIKQYFFIAVAIFFFVLWFTHKKRA